ncbi:MAG: DUF962 domain-containing protein [Phycisphaerae bacterium]|nr:DUF962 domain-containing protein [Phycisphaerae bacterium]
MPAWLDNWFERHQHPLSRGLHYVGIPLTIAFIPLAAWQLVEWRWDLWWRPTVLLVVGYGLQWMGHVIEGNDMGEVILVKRLLGRPYVAVSPRYERREQSAK